MRLRSNLQVLALIIFPTLSVQGAPAISGVTVDNITKSNARVLWQTSTANTAPSQILYGISNSYGLVMDVQDSQGQTLHPWYISGLAANTLYHFCPQSTDASGTSVCDGTQNDYTFTTASQNSPMPDTPQLPQSEVDTTLPTQTGHVLTVNSANCNDPNTGLQAQINAANLGDTIVLPAGMVCDGEFTFPAKTTGSGWIVIRTSTPDSQLPPPGTRITPAQLPLMATLRNSAPSIQAYGGSGGDACTLDRGGPYSSQFGFTWTPSNALGLYRCTNGTWQTVPPVASGTQVPSTCNVGDWFFKTDQTRGGPGNNQGLGWWCVSPNHYSQVYLGNNGNPGLGGVALFPPNAHNYRFIGIELTVLPTLPNEPFMNFITLMNMDPTNYNIVVDRCYLHGLGYPSRLNYGIYWAGRNMAIVDSYIDQVNAWQADTSGEYGSCAILTDYGPGPGKVMNNYISAVGITLFFTDNGTSTSPDAADFEIRRNYFYRDEKFRSGSPASDGHNYFNRHHLEFKRGRRMLVDGNIFENNWSYTQQGDMINITPRPAVYEEQSPPSGVSDITFTNNIIQKSAMAMQIAGHTNASGNTEAMETIGQRVQVANNLMLQINGDYTVSGYQFASYGGGRWTDVFEIMWGPEDLVIQHNTMVDVIQAPGFPTVPFAMYGFDNEALTHTTPGANLLYRDNIMDYADEGFALGGTEGLPGINAFWTRNPNPGWWIDHNVFPGNPSKASINPAGNFWPATDSSVGFSNPSGTYQSGNYTLAASPYSGQASDGTDPGVNWPALQAATLHTVDGAWGGPAPTLIPTNQPPVVSAGSNQTVTLPSTATLNGSVKDDGLFQPISSTWSVISGPGNVNFLSPNSPITVASFSQAGAYELQLSAYDGQYTVTSSVIVTVNPAVSAGSAPNTIGLSRIYPNPFRASRGDTEITFDQMPLNSTVKIFTVSGHWVRTLDGSAGAANWDLKNNSGANVASGLYIYLITDSHNNETRGKFAVIR